MGWFFGSAFSYFVVFGGVFGFRAGNWVLCSDFSSRVLVECIFWVFFFFVFYFILWASVELVFVFLFSFLLLVFVFLFAAVVIMILPF